MSRATPSIRGFMERTRRTIDILGSTGLLSPRYMISMARGLHETGPSTASGVFGGRFYRGAEPAIIDDAGTLSFAQLRMRTLSIAQGLRAAGVGPGHNVAILARNHRGFVEATSAAALLGADSLFLNTGFAAPQLEDVLTREGAGTLIYDEEFSDIVKQGASKLQRFLSWSDGDPAVPTLDHLAQENAPEALPRPAKPGRATILTSGTTGTPKGANRSSASGGLTTAVGFFERMPYRVGETMLVCAPTFHAWGLVNFAMGNLFANTLVFHRKFDPERVLQAIEKYRVDAMAVVPVMLNRILALDPALIRKYDTSSLRMVGCSGSALPGELALRWMDTFGDNLHNMYGSTEVSVTSIAVPAELRAAPGTAGRPPLGTTIRIYDENDRPVPQGTTGRIFVGSGAQFEGYTGGGTKKMLDGLMSIGDVGHFDENGLLFVEGRDDDMIVSGGENVFPAEVEDLLSDHPALLEAAVIGVPDDAFGQRLKAFVVRNDGATLSEEDAKDYVKNNLARHKVPREVVFLDEIPRNPSGKVLKRVLREMGDTAEEREVRDESSETGSANDSR
jgi:acyl-CoA synthetase (AMP-forming)/AMP-acid ligase II